MDVNSQLICIKTEYDQLIQKMDNEQFDDVLQEKIHELALKLISFKKSVSPKDNEDISFKHTLDSLSKDISAITNQAFQRSIGLSSKQDSTSEVISSNEVTFSTGNVAVNTFTNMVKDLVKRINTIITESIFIEPTTQTEGVEKIANDIQSLLPQILLIQEFVKQAVAEDPNFKNTLNDEGMPPRIVEEELELAIRHDLEAVSRSMGLGTSDENYDVGILSYTESTIYGGVEDREGPLMTFNNLKERYDNFAQFLSEKCEGKFAETNFGKRYTPQEAHVIIHIASFVNSVKDAAEYAKHDEGRHLCNLLRTYIEWAYDPGTHVHYDIDIVTSHGSLRGIAEKNGKTMIDWVIDLHKQFRKDQAPKVVIELFNELETTLRKGLYKDPETGELVRTKTLDPLNSENIKFKGPFKPVKESVGSITGLDLATNQDLEETRYTAEDSFPRKNTDQATENFIDDFDQPQEGSSLNKDL